MYPISLYPSYTPFYIYVFALIALILGPLAKTVEVLSSFVNQKITGSQTSRAERSYGEGLYLAQIFPFRIEQLKSPEVKGLTRLILGGVYSFVCTCKASFHMTYICPIPTISKTRSLHVAEGWSRPECWPFKHAQPSS